MIIKLGTIFLNILIKRMVMVILGINPEKKLRLKSISITADLILPKITIEMPTLM
jgi:hypothetical protein